MAKTFLYKGNRLRKIAAIPYHQIDRLVGDLHVSLPDGEVVELIAKQAKGRPGWNARLVGHAAKYAVAKHHANRRLYGHVMGGLL